MPLFFLSVCFHKHTVPDLYVIFENAKGNFYANRDKYLFIQIRLEKTIYSFYFVGFITELLLALLHKFTLKIIFCFNKLQNISASTVG